MSIGLQGVKDSDVEKVRDTIKTVIEKAKEEGFDPKRIEAAIHQMELGQKHVRKINKLYDDNYTRCLLFFLKIFRKPLTLVLPLCTVLHLAGLMGLIQLIF